MEPTTSTRPRIRLPYVVVAILAAVVLAGAVVLFVGPGSGTSSTAGPSSTGTARHVARPAGAKPSKSARMICAAEAQKDLASALGVTSTSVTDPTWVDHVYSCRYMYQDGNFALSVKELSDRAGTTAYFKSLRTQLGESERLPGVAQGAFVTSNGSLVLRKDYKVLVVDTSDVPEPFGAGFATRDQVAVGVGVTLLGCWTGS